MRNALLWTIIVALRPLRNLKTTCLTVTTEISLRCRIDEVYTFDIHEIIVEANGQRIGNGHETALTIRLHIILLTADIYYHLTSLRSIDAEISTTLTVNLWELISRDGILYSYSISRNLNSLRHFDIWTLGLIAKVTGHSLAITATKLAVASSIEVQTVGTIGTAIRRYHLRGMKRKWQLIYLLLTADANALTIGLNDITSIKGHILRFKLKVTTQIVINLLHHTSPLGVAGIGLTLVHQDTLDNTILLSLLCQSYQALIWVIVISSQHTLHPVRRLGLYIVINTVGQESFDIDTTDSNMNYTYLNIFGQ